MAQNAPRVAYAYPAGGQQGTTCRIMLGGQFLRDDATVLVSGAGVTAKVVEYVRPISNNQAGEMRDRLKELAKGPKTPETLKEIAEITRKLATFIRNASPAMAEVMTLDVAVAADAAPGPREMRLMTPTGLSAPLVFIVGDLPECRETEVMRNAPPTFREAVPGAEPLTLRRNEDPPRPPALGKEQRIALPTTVNGQVMPGDVDRFRFEARKGQRLVVAVQARAILPYLADAVPGWFQAVAALYDGAGREVAYNDDFRFRPDPVLAYDIPADGEYILEIRDSIYRGREDFVYRVSVGELPFITSIFPLGGRAGEAAPVEVRGWNLPSKSLTPRAAEAGLAAVSVSSGKIASNALPFSADTLPEALEKEPNNAAAAAQAVTLPLVVNGRIGVPGDEDVFRFAGRAGDVIVAEVLARRLSSPVDSALRLTDAAGKQLAANDDHEDKGSGLDTHHADSYLRFALPADGTYYVHVTDAQRQGGPEFGYRLRLGAPRPDFELRVSPAGLTLRGGTSAAMTAYALRRDGFDGEISLTLKDAPAGFSLGGARVPAGQTSVRFTLAAPAGASTGEPPAVVLEGRAEIGGRTIVRRAVPAEDMMQAFAYRHLVPAQELRVAVAGRGGRYPVRVLGTMPVRIPSGKTVRVEVGMPTNTPMGKVEFELSNPPDGIALADASADGLRTGLTLSADAAKAKPGLAGNLIVNAFMTREPPADAAKTKSGPRRMLIGTLPAIPFEVVGP
jgi:hypothetical protein